MKNSFALCHPLNTLLPTMDFFFLFVTQLFKINEVEPEKIFFSRSEQSSTCTQPTLISLVTTMLSCVRVCCCGNGTLLPDRKFVVLFTFGRIQVTPLPSLCHQQTTLLACFVLQGNKKIIKKLILR